MLGFAINDTILLWERGAAMAPREAYRGHRAEPQTTAYAALQGALVSGPKDAAARPSKQALQWHFAKSGL